uniref:Xylulose kinase-1 n=1 Tax=Tanacetum cinerariifolium TaxID=118510 RepID=A0A6L2KMK6_TANCI|nr:hypothetical protein [Tanacetum cinerariifolium]
MAQTSVRNYAQKGNHQQYARMPLPNPQKHVIPTTVLTKSTLVPITVARPVTSVVPKYHVTRPRPTKPIVTKLHSPPRRHINHSPSPKAGNFPPKVTDVKAPMVTTAKGVQGKWEWNPKCPILDHGNPQHAFKDPQVVSEPDASEGFNQIIDFLNASSIKYALTVNPNIYVSCIKKFWTSVSIKMVNDVPRLQALVDKKKVIITEATIRDALHLDDAEGIDCLPNEKIFTELARMGYEKPLTKLTFYKAFFSSQWKFLIHTILQCMSAKRTSWNKFSSSMASAVICLSTSAAVVNVEDVSTAGVAASAANDEVHASDIEPSIPSPTPPTLPPQPSQDQPFTFQRVKKIEMRNKVSKLRRLKKVGTAQRIETSDDTVMDDVSKQGMIIVDIDADKDVTLKDVVAFAKDVQDAEIEESSDVQGRQAESQAQIYQTNLEHADKVLSMQDVDIEPAELQEVVEVVTTAKLIIEVVTAASAIITVVAPERFTAAAAPILTTAPSAARRRKGVVIRDPEETATSSIIIHTEPKSKDKGKGIMVEEPKPLKKQPQIEQDKAYARELEAELNNNIDWDEVIDNVQRKEKEGEVVKTTLLKYIIILNYKYKLNLLNSPLTKVKSYN